MFRQSFCPLLLRGKVSSASRIISQPVRHHTIKSRVALLDSVYRLAFSNLKKGSPEYVDLARSGKVWETFFRPGNIEPYLRAQSDLKKTLTSIDELKGWCEQNVEARISSIRAQVCQYAQQSTSIEQNLLQLSDSLVIFDNLEKQLFSSIDSLEIMSACALSELTLPTAHKNLPGKNANHVTELRNHIIISRYLTEIGLKNPGTVGISIVDIKKLSAAMLRETDAETLYALSWGKRTQIGDYRSVPISVKSNPMRIFPYPEEVPACMDRYVEWRDRNHIDKILHPIILATHLYTYFVHIHPFLDGNGRLGRILMANYLVRQGYLPVVFAKLDRGDYLRVISDAQDGKPGNLCTIVARTQLEMMQEITMQK